MKLSEAFKQLPPDMVLKSQIDGEERSAAEWAEKLKTDGSTAKIGELKLNYGKVKLTTIYFPGVGMGFRECKYT